MKNMLLLGGLWCLLLTTACAQTKNLYNDDPTQRLPLGTERPVPGRIAATAGTVDEARVHPPNWWVGMDDSRLEILLYDQGIGDREVSIRYPGVTLERVDRPENKNYLFLQLHIGPGTQPGQFDIVLTGEGKRSSYPYELWQRNPSSQRIQGLDGSDFIYLIMPDRFANGDPKNDSYRDMNQVGINRDKMFFRHGGDLQGVIDRLDYLEALGVTAIWLNPVLENDQPYESYHGYAVTDHYAIDKRFGSNEDYRRFVDLCHARGMKVVMDIIHNHVGDQHWFIQDLPETDWIHQYDSLTRTTYRAPTLMDPHAARADRELMSDGWFDVHMPDLNQQNPHLAAYLTQNNLWWTEYSGHDAYRIDTYAYPDQDFMSDWGARMQREHPRLTLYGETWVHGPAVQAWFTQNNNLQDTRNSNLPAVTDFQLHYAIEDALQHQQGWTSGVAKIYYTLAQDFLYEDPDRLVVFLDNHDKSRFFSVIGEDLNKFKSGIAFMLTTRGIPQMYYGTEILLKNYADPDGKVRQDFPGGWKGDAVDKFNPDNLQGDERAAYDYVSILANFRKTAPALHHGHLTQFVPENDCYVYFRHTGLQTIMVVMNTKDEAQTVDTQRYRERMAGFTKARDVVSDTELSSLNQLSVPRNSVLVLELLR